MKKESSDLISILTDETFLVTRHPVKDLSIKKKEKLSSYFEETTRLHGMPNAKISFLEAFIRIELNDTLLDIPNSLTPFIETRDDTRLQYQITDNIFKVVFSNFIGFEVSEFEVNENSEIIFNNSADQNFDIEKKAS